MSDSELIELFFARDENAISAVTQTYGAYMQKIAVNILGSREDSEEAVNDALFAIWHSIPPERPIHLSAYIAKLVRNCSISAYRKRESKKRRLSQYALSIEEVREVLPSREAPESELEAKLLEELIARFVSGLSREERALFLGRYYFFDPVKEVARYTGMSISKAKSMLYRLRLRLKDYLGKEGYTV